MLKLALALETASSEALDMLLLRTSVLVEEGSKQHARGLVSLRHRVSYVLVSCHPGALVPILLFGCNCAHRGQRTEPPR